MCVCYLTMCVCYMLMVQGGRRSHKRATSYITIGVVVVMVGEVDVDDKGNDIQKTIPMIPARITTWMNLVMRPRLELQLEAYARRMLIWKKVIKGKD